MPDLNNIRKGTDVTVESIEGDDQFSSTLMSYGLFQGTHIKVVRNDKWQDIVLIARGEKRIAIRRSDSKKIKVVTIHESKNTLSR